MLPVAFTSSQPYANFDRTRLSKSIRSSRLMRPPGSTYSYSNFGFAVLGLALEKVYGEPFEELLPRLTARLGCGEIRLPRDGDLVAKGLAVAPWKMAAFAPAGAATATLDAMITFAQINLNPNRAAELSMAIQERRRYRTHPPFGSGLPLTFALAAIAGGVTRAIPDSFFVPLLCAEMATFSAGWLGGGLVTLAWEAATFWNCSPLAMAEQRVGFGLFATLLGLYAANRQQSQSMGLGWHSAGAASDAVIWHNGGTAGFRSCIGLRPAAATGTIVLAANKQSVDSLARHLSKF
jgi:CubicO group peptidase (beta-lactamase class C family)